VQERGGRADEIENKQEKSKTGTRTGEDRNKQMHRKIQSATGAGDHLLERSHAEEENRVGA
jgi:hypothetical protein